MAPPTSLEELTPQAPQSEVDQPGRYADTAVSALLAALAQFGSKPSRLTAVLTGGARMFSFVYSGDSDIGTRNVAATRGALAAAGVPIAASATGGSTGRSIRVHAAAGSVRLREAGSDRELYRPAGTGAAVGGAS